MLPLNKEVVLQSATSEAGELDTTVETKMIQTTSTDDEMLGSSSSDEDLDYKNIQPPQQDLMELLDNFKKLRI